MKRLFLFSLVLIVAFFLVVGAEIFVPEVARSQSATAVPSPTMDGTGSDATLVSVYVLSRGGKYVGDDVGGAQVSLRDARSGELLASGRTHGGSGVADLMTIDRARTTPLPTEDAAVFTATLMLSEPRLIEVEAFGPLAAQGSAVRVTQTEWVLPQALAADANKLRIEIPGLNVDILNPPAHFLPKTKPPLDIHFQVNVTMMCGCPIGPGVAWHPEDFTVKALVKKPDGTSELLDLHYDPNAPDNAPSQFIGTYTATESGIYEAIVLAHQAKVDNSGSDRVTFILP